MPAARWGLREQVVATQSPPVSRFAIDVGPFTLTGTAPPVDGEPYAFAPQNVQRLLAYTTDQTH